MSRRLVLMISVATLLLRCSSVATAFNYGGGGSSGGGSPTATPAPGSLFAVANLAATISGEGQPDPHLINAWGLVAGPSTPWWVANNVTSTSTLYSGTGAVVPLVVSVAGAPTGIVFNGGVGVRAAARQQLGLGRVPLLHRERRHQRLEPDRAADRGHHGRRPLRRGCDLQGTRDRLDRRRPALRHRLPQRARRRLRPQLQSGEPTGAFVDKKIPHRYAPFGIQNINGALFVTYARHDKTMVNDVPGAGTVRGHVRHQREPPGRVATRAPQCALGIGLAPSTSAPRVAICWSGTSATA